MLKALRRMLFGPSRADQIADLREQVQQRALEAQLTFYDNLVDPREPLYDDSDFWQPVGPGEAVPVHYDNKKQGEVVPVYLTEWGLKTIRDRARKLAATNEFAINAHENRISYVVGRGYKYKAVRKGVKLDAGKVDPLARAVQGVVDDFLARTCWGEREQEALRRCDRDGEAILRLFHGNEGKCDVRFVEPEMLRDTTGRRENSFGVITDPKDVEDVKGYSIIDDPMNPQPEFVEAEDVCHIKLNTDSTAKRGLPTLYPVRKNLERAEKLLRNMSTLAAVQATYAVIRKHKQFSASAVSAFRTAQADTQVSHPMRPGTTAFYQGLPPGAIIDTTENTDYEFPAAHVDASSLVAILQAELRAVAARVVMPEFMLTVDASNNNYASAMVAEAPSTKNFERLQAYFGRRFGDGGYTANLRIDGVLWRVIAYAVSAGRLPRQALTEIELQVEAPSATARDKDKESSRAERLNKAGVLSKETWSQWENLDRQQEKRHLAKEQPPQQLSQPQQGGGFGDFGGGFGGGGDDAGGGDDQGDDFDPFGIGVTEGYSGRKTDSRGRVRCYSDGRPVPCHTSDTHRGDEAHRQAHDHLAALLANPHAATADMAKQAIESLHGLTAKEVHALRQSHGLTAKGKKAELVQQVVEEAARRVGEKEQWARKAKAAGVDPDEMLQTADAMFDANEQHRSLVARMLKEARRQFAHEGGKRLSRNHPAFKGGDHAQIQGMDAVARTMAGRYPDLLGAHGYGDSGEDESAAAKLFDYLAAGTPDAKPKRHWYGEALDYLSQRSSAARDEVPF